jgi:S1-C subfamily serine protease
VSSGRAWLGVDLRTMAGGGALIAAVVAKGPAGHAGLRPGQVILRVGGTATPTTDDVAVALATRKPGATIPVEVRGPAGTKTGAVKLGEAPAR